MQRFSDYRLFMGEFFRTFHTTGSIIPSSRALSLALASQVEKQEDPQRILEVGPGTGVVTSHILQGLGPEDRLDLVELNPRFADSLRNRFAEDPEWSCFAERVRVLEMPFQQLEATGQYQAIVSGLPLNIFSVEMVQEILQVFHRVAKPQATLSFFEYVAVRKIRGLVGKQADRLRLAGVERLLLNEFKNWEVKRQCIMANVPPAWVHHLQLPGSQQQTPAKRVAEVAATQAE